MKITKTQLNLIVKEEINKVINEKRYARSVEDIRKVMALNKEMGIDKYYTITDEEYYKLKNQEAEDKERADLDRRHAAGEFSPMGYADERRPSLRNLEEAYGDRYGTERVSNAALYDYLATKLGDQLAILLTDAVADLDIGTQMQIKKLVDDMVIREEQ